MLGATRGVAAVVCAAWLCAAQAGTAAPTVAENEAAARSDATMLLADVPLPSGAVPSAVEPAGDRGILASPGVRLATPNDVDDTAWWVMPGTRAAVLTYIKAHAPPGTRVVSSGSGATYGVTESEWVALAWPTVPGVLANRWLVLTVASLSSGEAGLRADTQVVWITPRPPSETIPPGARLLRVSVGSHLEGNRPRQRPFSVSSRRRIEAVVALLNSLPAGQPGTRSCPVDFGIYIRLAFYARAHARRPMAVADIDPQGCGGVNLTLAGRRQPPLKSEQDMTARLDRLLGARLNVVPS